MLWRIKRWCRRPFGAWPESSTVARVDRKGFLHASVVTDGHLHSTRRSAYHQAEEDYADERKSYTNALTDHGIGRALSRVKCSAFCWQGLPGVFGSRVVFGGVR